MNFEEALPALKAGESITRNDLSWIGLYLTLLSEEGYNSIELFNTEGEWQDCSHAIANNDLLATDWEILK